MKIPMMIDDDDGQTKKRTDHYPVQPLLSLYLFFHFIPVTFPDSNLDASPFVDRHVTGNSVSA